MVKRYANTEDPLTLEHRITAGQVRLKLRRGEVLVMDERRKEIVRYPLLDAARKLGVLHGATSPVAALVPLGGGRELRIGDVGLGLWIGFEERTAVILLLEGTPTWEDRIRADPRTFMVPGVVRAGGTELHCLPPDLLL